MAVAPTIATVADKMPLKKRAVRLALRLVRSAALMYLIVCAAMYLLQNYLIFPGSLQQGAPETKVAAYPGTELVSLKAADGTALTGFFGKAKVAEGDGAEETHPTLVYFYGNGECMNNVVMVFEMFRRMGVNCMLIDYPGFGMSQGKAAEQGCYEAAEAAYQHVLTRPDVDRSRIMAAGWSLGGAVAIDLAHRHRNDGTICGLITFSTFTSMDDMAKLNYPFLPVTLFLRHHFYSADKIREIKVPYFLGHCRHDPAIPFAHADRLAAGYGGGAQGLMRFTSEVGEHNDFYDACGQALEDALAAFLKRCTAK